MARTVLAIALAIGVAMAGVSPAQAAGFNCARATTLVERAICGSPALSRADDRLNRTYKQALANSLDPDSLRAQQRVWVAQRDACRTAQCVADAYAARLPVLEALRNGSAPLPRTAAGQPLIFRPAQVEDVGAPGRTIPMSALGTVSFGHDEAGGRYDLVTADGVLTLGYLWDFSDGQTDVLAQLDESRVPVRVVGTLMVYDDGGSVFSRGASLSLYAAR